MKIFVSYICHPSCLPIPLEIVIVTILKMKQLIYYSFIMENKFSNVNINLICQTFESISRRQNVVSQSSRFRTNINKVAAIIQEFDATNE